MTTRREFVSHLASTAALSTVGRTVGVEPRFLSAFEAYPNAGAPDLKELCDKALEAARAAGAKYADVRLTLTKTEGYGVGNLPNWGGHVNDVHAAVGVRSLADGAWGFAASNVWGGDEVARLGRASVAQAKSNARRRVRSVELGDTPPVVRGEWKTPIKRDPFTIPIPERVDVLWALREATQRLDVSANYGCSLYVTLRRQEKTFASTDGSFLSQTLYHIDPSLSVYARAPGRNSSRRTYDRLHPAAAGWEIFSETALARDLPALIDEVVEALDAEPVDPDRYDIVCDGYTTARIVGHTIGLAAELDRVLGYEANAAGTSYLAPSEDMLGKFALGPRFLNVVAERSRIGAPATVRWDDEGVVPEEYTLIKDGVLVDYHTNRELAAGKRSHGCASSDTANNIALCHTANVTMLPGNRDTSFQDLIAGLEKGLVIIGGEVKLDRQQLNGEITAEIIYEVRNGKRTRFIRNAELLFRAPELWKGLQAIGGPASQVWSGMTSSKGQPDQSHTFGISAVPARFNRVSVTDRFRQA